MKKIIGGLVVLMAAIFGFASTASAHHLDVTGESSCVREDGSWDWTASYTIPNESWAQGLTVQVTWHPGSSGTSSSSFVDVTVDGQWSNGNSGGGSTRIHKGKKCPTQETTTTSTSPETTSTTSTIVTTTTVPVTTSTVAVTTSSPSVETTSPTTVQTSTAEDTTTTLSSSTNSDKEGTAKTGDLPATGPVFTIWGLIIAGIIVIVGIILVLRTRRK